MKHKDPYKGYILCAIVRIWPMPPLRRPDECLPRTVSLEL